MLQNNRNQPSRKYKISKFLLCGVSFYLQAQPYIDTGKKQLIWFAYKSKAKWIGTITNHMRIHTHIDIWIASEFAPTLRFNSHACQSPETVHSTRWYEHTVSHSNYYYTTHAASTCGIKAFKTERHNKCKAAKCGRNTGARGGVYRRRHCSDFI